MVRTARQPRTVVLRRGRGKPLTSFVARSGQVAYAHLEASDDHAERLIRPALSRDGFPAGRASDPGEGWRHYSRHEYLRRRAWRANERVH